MRTVIPAFLALLLTTACSAPANVFAGFHDDAPVVPDTLPADAATDRELATTDTSAPEDHVVRPVEDTPPPEDHAIPTDAAVDAPDVLLVEVVSTDVPLVDVPQAEASAGDAIEPVDTSCGARGESCCPGRVCRSGLGCGADLRCGGCGAQGQPCCWGGPGALCSAGFTCRGTGTSAACECGNPGEACCGGLVCNVVPGRANPCQITGSVRVCG